MEIKRDNEAALSVNWNKTGSNDEYVVNDVGEVEMGSKYYKELTHYETQKNKILQSGKFRSSVIGFFFKLDKFGHNEVKYYGKSDGYYMISPNIHQSVVEEEQNIEYNIWGDDFNNDLEPRGGRKIRTKRRRKRIKTPKTIKRRRPKKVSKKTIKRRPKRKNIKTRRY